MVPAQLRCKRECGLMSSIERKGGTRRDAPSASDHQQPIAVDGDGPDTDFGDHAAPSVGPAGAGRRSECTTRSRAVKPNVSKKFLVSRVPGKA